MGSLRTLERPVLPVLRRVPSSTHRLGRYGICLLVDASVGYRQLLEVIVARVASYYNIVQSLNLAAEIILESGGYQ